MSNTVLAFVIIIGGYVLGIWVGAFIVGLRDRFSSPDVTMDDCDWILCAIWPISLVLWMIMVFCDFIVWVGHFIPKKELLKKVLWCISLLFRPYRIGVLIQSWYKK